MKMTRTRTRTRTMLLEEEKGPRIRSRIRARSPLPLNTKAGVEGRIGCWVASGEAEGLISTAGSLLRNAFDGFPLPISLILGSGSLRMPMPLSLGLLPFRNGGCCSNTLLVTWGFPILLSPYLFDNSQCRHCPLHLDFPFLPMLEREKSFYEQRPMKVLSSLVRQRFSMPGSNY